MALPPPTAMITSGLNSAIRRAPSIAHAIVGSGATLENVATAHPCSSRLRSIGFV